VVLPLMLGGVLLAYTRTRLGLRAAMVQHGCYNAALVGLTLFGP
jgi:membrane protease YdiL (CAAX protease family)